MWKTAGQGRPDWLCSNRPSGFFFFKLETPKEQKTAFVFTPARTESTPKFLARHSEAMANCILTFCSELKAETQI